MSIIDYVSALLCVEDEIDSQLLMLLKTIAVTIFINALQVFCLIFKF